MHPLSLDQIATVSGGLVFIFPPIAPLIPDTFVPSWVTQARALGQGWF
jgi:hypothetical protein